MRQILSLTRKELDGYFSSPMALIFVGVFLMVTLFTFFWIDAFWARGTADVRPLFRWMPILMIFLVAALTMRQWSEEQQSGTLELLLTMPMRLWQLVLGKFFAVLGLVIVALLLTLFLPMSVALLGSLDIGPVAGGYMAAVLMASAYIAMGLFMSSRTDNQLVALILTVLLGGVFHIIGTTTITGLFSSTGAEILRAFSTTSRFASIERGVIDFRDLLYYVSLTVVFLVLNVWSLDSKRWSSGKKLGAYRLNSRLMIVLIALNVLVFNVLFHSIRTLRWDLTAGREYSLSPVTRDLLNNLNEPLLIRAYLSENNHPLLEPLIPRVKDMLHEYEVASGRELTVEILDPIKNPDLEAEANQTYGIRPTPLQTADRTGSTLMNVYFDVLIRYGDQSKILSFWDLIEVEEFGSQVEVRLRNLEYDLTSSIKQVISGFQSIDAVLATLDDPAVLTLYVTPNTLPEMFAGVPDVIETIASEIQAQSNGKLLFQSVDVDDPNNTMTPQRLFDQYQIQPIATSLFSPTTFYLHMVLETQDQAQVIYPSGELSETEIRAAIESVLKRISSGFLRVIGVWTPPATAQQDMFGQPQQSLSQYTVVPELLRENYEVRQVNLANGYVPIDIDALLIIAPQGLSDLERYAIDQYLMRGGAVFVAAGNYRINQNPYDGSLILEPLVDGLQDMLAAYGVTVEEQLVLDTQNEPFPVQVQRDAGGFIITEIQAMNYPYFVDVRPGGMNRSSAIVQNLPAVTMNWVSPLTIDESLITGRDVTVLLQSTSNSWATVNLEIEPDMTLYPVNGFPIDGEQKVYPLAISMVGSFESFFKDKPSPFETAEVEGTTIEDIEANPAAAVGTIAQSPQTARLIVVGSAEFLNDNVLQLSRSFSGDRYLNTLQFVQNSVDWFVEDTELATIRSRGASVRLLDPMTESEQSRWEIANYGVGLLAVLGLGILWRLRKRSEKPMELLRNEPSPAEI